MLVSHIMKNLKYSKRTSTNLYHFLSQQLAISSSSLFPLRSYHLTTFFNTVTLKCLLFSLPVQSEIPTLCCSFQQIFTIYNNNPWNFKFENFLAYDVIRFILNESQYLELWFLAFWPIFGFGADSSLESWLTRNSGPIRSDSMSKIRKF